MNLEQELNKEYSLQHIEEVAAFINKNPQYIKKNVELMLFGDTKTSQKASWVLTKFNIFSNIELISHLDFIIKNLNNNRHDAVYRSLARYFSIITKDYSDFLNDKQIDFIIDFSFSRLINIKEKAAIRAFSMFSLKNLAHLRPWVKDELILYIENNMANSLPSFQSSGRRVLKELGKL